MTEKMKAALAEEIEVISQWLEYAEENDLVPFDTLEDAKIQIDGMNEDRDPDDPLIGGLNDPATMLIVWNYCVAEEKARLERIREERERPNREYLLKTVSDGIRQSSIKTGKQIADIYDFDQEVGIYTSMEVYDLDTLTKIDLDELVTPILENKRWMEQEYRDYCENIREYGLDFEGRNL